MTTLNPKRRELVSHDIKRNFTSLPGQQFFVDLTNKLIEPETNSKTQIGKINQRRRVRIRCKWSEMSMVPNNNGSTSTTEVRGQLTRHRLSRVREEDTDLSSDEVIGCCSSSNSTRFHDISSEHKYQKLGALENFQLILQEMKASLYRQTTSQQSYRSPFRLFHREDPVPNKDVSKKCRSIVNQPRCYELFLIHQTSQLVHRNQPLIEGERLAKRLKQVLTSNV